MTEHTPHISPKKQREVEDIKKLFQEYPVVGVADLHGLPAANLQRIKKRLRAKTVFVTPKRRRALLALDALQDTLPNVQELRAKVQGMVALLFTREDPFQLYKIVQKNIAPAPAKAGQESPEDITIPAGPTQFMAGPMIGELGQLGLKTEVKEGKITIKEDKVIVKQGQIITAKVAELLTKFGIEPMKVGLNVVCTYQKGEILGKEILGVSEEEYIGFIQSSHQEALNLAVFITYPCKETIDLLIQKAARESKGVADAIKFEELQQPQEQPQEKKKEEAPQPEEREPAQEEKPQEASPQEQQQPKEEQPEPAPLQQPPSEPVHPQPAPVQHAEKIDHPVHQRQEKAPTEENPAQLQARHEQPQQQRKTDEQVAQEVLKRLQDEKMKQQPHPTRKVELSPVQQQEKDLTKIINKLKDQKSKGK